jgi:hypothetical protein
MGIGSIPPSCFNGDKEDILILIDISSWMMAGNKDKDWRDCTALSAAAITSR